MSIKILPLGININMTLCAKNVLFNNTDCVILCMNQHLPYIIYIQLNLTSHSKP